MHKSAAAPMFLPTAEARAIGTKLLDRYALPKVAMALILISTAAGAWLSLLGIGAAQVDLALAKWAHFLALSIVLGGSLWGAFFSRLRYQEQDIETPVPFLLREYSRFMAIQRYATLVGLLAGLYIAARYASLFVERSVSWYATLLGLQVALWLGLAVVVLVGSGLPRDTGDSWLPRTQRWLKVIALVAAGSLLTMAALDVVPQTGADAPVILIRWLHLSAFGAWFGGAVWNVFVAVPAARETLCFETIFAAASQLEQFRKVVRLALPLVLLSGLYQSYRWVGLDISALLGLPVGLIIVLKVGLIATLVGIFIACPMWRACSPIAGVCDITDIDPTPSGVEREAQTGDSAPARCHS